MRSFSNTPFSSISFTCGRIFSSANCRMLSRKRISSSVRVVSGVGWAACRVSGMRRTFVAGVRRRVMLALPSAGDRWATFVEKGAKIVPDRASVFRSGDAVLQVLCYGSNDVNGKDDLPLYKSGQALIGFLRPFGGVETLQQIAKAGVTAFSVELMPRTTRAQSMDALSSMATICGYKAVLLAAEPSPRVSPMMTTAAGTITPARVFLIAAGAA